MELNNYMRTHIPKKKISAFPHNKTTFANLYSRFKKTNPQQPHTQSPQTCKLSQMIQRQSYSVQGKDKQPNPSSNLMASSTVSSKITKRSNILIQHPVKDDLFIQGLELQKKQIYQKYIKASDELELVSKQFLEFSEMVRQKLRDYQMDIKILTKQNDYYKVQLMYIKKTQDKEPGEIRLQSLSTQTQTLNSHTMNVEIQAQPSDPSIQVQEIQRAREVLNQLQKDHRNLQIELESGRVNSMERECELQRQIQRLNQDITAKKNELEENKQVSYRENIGLKEEINRLEQEIIRLNDRVDQKNVKPVSQSNVVSEDNFSQTETSVTVQGNTQTIDVVSDDREMQTVQISSTCDYQNQEVSSQTVIVEWQSKHTQTNSINSTAQASIQTLGSIDQQHQPSYQPGLVEEIEQNRTQMCAMREEIQRLKGQKVEIQEQNKELVFKIQEFEQQIASKEEQIEGYRNQIGELMEQIHKMEEVEYQENQEGSKDHRPAQQPQDEEQVSQLSILTLQNSELTNRLSTIQDDNSAEKQQYLNRIQRLQQECQDLQSEIDNLSKSYDEVVQKLQSVELSNQRGRDQCQEFKFKMTQMQEENNNKERYIEQLGRELSDQGRQMQNLRNADCQECKGLEMELSEMRKQLKSKIQEIQFESQAMMGRERQKTSNY